MKKLNQTGKYIMSFLPKILFWPILLCFSLSALSKEHEGKEVEKIDVIGSHIKRTNVEGPSPVLVIDREQIEMSGYNSLSDVLRDLPVASLGSSSEQSLSFPPSSTSTSLRGHGQKSILFLLNGRRLSSYGGTTGFDLTQIPLSVVESIEILADGVSALYGSGIGGVINVRTKKDQTGGQVNVQGSLVQREEGNSFSALASLFDFWNWNETGLPEGETSWRGKGDKLSIDASYGGNKNDINYLVGGQVRFDAPLYLRDREFGRLPSAAKGSPTGSPGSWSDDGGQTFHSAKDCPETHKKENGLCGFDWSPYMQFTPQILQTSAFAKMDMPLMDDLNFTGQALYSWTRAHGILAPPPDSFAAPDKPGDPDYRIPVEVANKWGLGAKAPVTVVYRLVEEESSGPRQSFLNSHFYQTHLSLSKLVGDTMELEGHLNLSGSYYSSVGKGYFNKEKLFNMAKEGTFNPFLPSGQKNDISVASYEPTLATFDNLISFEPQLSGELAEIGGQPLMFAVGALGAHQYYMQDNDDITADGKQWGGGVAVDGEGNRFYGSLYGELSAHFFEMVELQLAGRSDYYDDFGLAWQERYVPLPFSPRVALSIQPLDELKFRSSWGLSFKAPPLNEMYHSETVSYYSARDYVVCDDEYFKNEENKKKDVCSEGTQYKTLSRANKNLQPEFSESVNVGVVLEPVDRFAISLDYYRTNQEDIAYKPGLRDIFKYEKKKGVSALKELGLDVKRSPDGKVESVVQVPANLSQYKVRGIDLTVDWTLPLMSGWDMGFRVEHSHILYVEAQSLTGGDIENPAPYYDWIVDWFGVENVASEERKNDIPWSTIPRWRNRAVFSMMNKDMGHKIDLIVHNIPSTLQSKGLQKEEYKEENIIDYYWQLDLRGAFRLTKDLSMIAGIQNILGFDRPYKNKEKGYYSPLESAGVYLNSSFYSMRGRSIDLRLIYDF